MIESSKPDVAATPTHAYVAGMEELARPKHYGPHPIIIEIRSTNR
jgi:hypothetical protein